MKKIPLLLRFSQETRILTTDSRNGELREAGFKVPAGSLRPLKLISIKQFEGRHQLVIAISCSELENRTGYALACEFSTELKIVAQRWRDAYLDFYATRLPEGREERLEALRVERKSANEHLRTHLRAQLRLASFNTDIAARRFSMG